MSVPIHDVGELGPPRIDLLVLMAGFGGGKRHTAMRA
jgi:hypothetical protein